MPPESTRNTSRLVTSPCNEVLELSLKISYKGALLAPSRGFVAPSCGPRSQFLNGTRRRHSQAGCPNLPISRPPSARPHLPCRLGGLLLIGHDEDMPNLVRDLRLRTNRLWVAASPTARKRL